MLMIETISLIYLYTVNISIDLECIGKLYINKEGHRVIMYINGERERERERERHIRYYL